MPRPPEPLPTWERPERLIIGRVLGPHGVDGSVRVEVLTHFPERIPGLRRLYVGDEPSVRRVKAAQLHPPYALIRLAGVTTPEAARELAGQYLRIDHSQAARLPPGEYYHWQIIGAAVEDEAGQRLGVVAEILETGANDVYVVRSAIGPELLLPVIAEVVRSIDVERGLITVRLLPGLVDQPAGGAAPPAPLRLDAGGAAVDVEDVAGDEGGGVGEQEEDRPDDIGR